MEVLVLRPSIMILIYPNQYERPLPTSSAENLLGKSATRGTKFLNFSNELHDSTPKTPPTCWTHYLGDDTVVPVENSIRFYKN